MTTLRVRPVLGRTGRSTAPSPTPAPPHAGSRQASRRAVDALLARLDAVVLAPPRDADPRLTGLAEEGLSALGPAVARADGRPGPVARSLALAGLSVAEPLRSAVAPGSCCSARAWARTPARTC